MRPIASVPIALLLTAAAASSPANASVTWSGIQQDMYAQFDADGNTYQETAAHNTIGFWDETVAASATIGGQSASISSSMTTDFTTNSISTSMSVMSFAPVGFPSLTAQGSNSALLLDFTLDQESEVFIDFAFTNTDADAGLVLLGLEHDTDPTIGVFTEFFVDDASNTMSYLLGAGEYTFSVSYWGSIVADGINRESEFSVTMTVIPAPAPLAALVPIALAATRRRR